MSRFLPGCTQGDIHAAVVRQDEGFEFFQSLLSLFIIQLRILLYHLLDLIGLQVLIVAYALGLKVIGRHSVADQEVLRSLGAPIREIFVVTVRPTLIGVTNKC